MPHYPVQVCLEFRWQHLGQILTGADGLLEFPVAPRQPGLYHFRLRGGGHARHYVGETDELRRRFQHYRTPGNSQQTNIRINAELREHLSRGGAAEVDIVTDRVTVTTAGKPVRVNLRDKAIRRLLEHAALVDGAISGTNPLNR